MRVAKNLLAATTLLLLLVASYMRLTETVVKGRCSMVPGPLDGPPAVLIGQLH